MPTKRQKGGAFEREVAVALSKWWSGGARDDVFWRTAGSGGRATARRKKGKNTRFSAGDITFTDPIARPFVELFNVECRWRKAFTLMGVLHDMGAETDWIRHWAKAARDAMASNREPLLVIKQNRGKPTVWMTGGAFAALWPGGPDGVPRICLHVTARAVRLSKTETVDLPEHDVYGMTLAAFVASASRLMIEEAAGDRGRARNAAGESHPPASAPCDPCNGQEDIIKHLPAFPGERGTAVSSGIRLPQEAWRKLRETLELDSKSSAFDPELRKEIREALNQVQQVTDSPSLVQAAQDILEWAAWMGGWEAPCWERLRLAVREAVSQSESPDSAEAAPDPATASDNVGGG